MADAESDRFDREAKAELDAVGVQIHEFTADLFVRMMQEVVTISPVLTGAYRASHAVLAEDLLIFEGPERPGGDEIIKPGSRAILEPPNPADVKPAILEHSQPGDELTLWNGRFYASFLEFGGPSTAPRSIYAQAREVGEAFAQSKA